MSDDVRSWLVAAGVTVFWVYIVGVLAVTQ